MTRLKERYHRFEIQKEELIMQQQRVGEELQRCHQQIMEIKSRTGQMELEMTNYGEENSRLTTQLKKTETQLADLQRQRMRIENELLAIQERQKARVGYDSGVNVDAEDHRAMFPEYRVVER